MIHSLLLLYLTKIQKKKYFINQIITLLLYLTCICISAGPLVVCFLLPCN